MGPRGAEPRDLLVPMVNRDLRVSLAKMGRMAPRVFPGVMARMELLELPERPGQMAR